ncbi:hypothetical protein GF359_05775 [candidate division WOR-3 bacterium]|uniref:Uncharacterized protein n=1 Tax=candidate division WOR-3 bacterium TaxID=2052148 RepID=A0A9D5QD57_UNCW3|nr:hypothetical protein [candidate division WOR-3 bacterium]MBD3364706.1 hypothetical protein [candidate division WOR-3 bacterium]
MSKLIRIMILITCVVSVGLGAEHASGVQADMVGQGFSYRLLSNSGWGAEMVVNGWYDMKDSTYGAGGELRLLKRFNTMDRVKLYLGLAGGYWQFENYYTLSWTDTLGYIQESEHFYAQEGYSIVGLVGVDLILFTIGENAGITLSPEFQFGYYTMPNRVDEDWIQEGEAEDYEEPRETMMISPGAGIGFKYFF